jgi:hypothetical protein
VQIYPNNSIIPDSTLQMVHPRTQRMVDIITMAMVEIATVIAIVIATVIAIVIVIATLELGGLTEEEVIFKCKNQCG